jgi:hypothetical protein
MSTFTSPTWTLGRLIFKKKYQHDYFDYDYFEPCNHILIHNVDIWYELSNNKVHIIDLFVFLCT